MPKRVGGQGEIGRRARQLLFGAQAGREMIIVKRGFLGRWIFRNLLQEEYVEGWF